MTKVSQTGMELSLDHQTQTLIRIYMMSIRCADDYPARPPTIKFNSKINLPCVNQ